MNFQTIRQAIFNWIRIATSETVGVTTYWDEPSAPRPASPAVRLSFATGPTGIGLDELRVDSDPNKFRIVGQRTMLLSVNAYGAQAYQLLSDILTSISNPTAMEGLGAVNISILKTSPPRDINVTLETKVDARTQMDVTLLATEDKLISLPSIVAVEISGEIQGIDIASDIDGITDNISANNGGV